MANGLPDLLLPNAVGSYNQGQATGNALQLQAAQLQGVRQAQDTRNALAQALPQVASGDATQTQNALQTVAGTGDTDAFTRISNIVSGLDDQKKAKIAATNQAVASVLLPLSQLPADQQQNAYTAKLASLKASGFDVSALPPDAQTGLPAAANHVMTMDQILQKSGYGPPDKGQVVGPGSVVYANGREAYRNPGVDPIVSVGDGMGGQQQYTRGADGQLHPLQLAGQPPGGAPQAPQDPGASISATMNDMLAHGVPQAAVEAYGASKMSSLPNTQVTMAGQNPTAPPQASQPPVSVSQAGPAISRGNVDTGVGGGLGYTPPKGSTDTVTKRATDLQSMQSQGIKVSDAQRQAYLTTGKFPEDSDRTLSDGEEKEAQALASYKAPMTAYMLSKPTMQPIVQRAMQLNPNFSANQYDINKKTLTDFASSNPSTSGGSVTAAMASLGHLDDMAEISKKLPSSIGMVNAGMNLFNSTFNTGDAASLKSWNTAKNFLAGETAKMVKNGVASEAETRELLDSLNPNDPNRDAALATFAKFIVDKTQAMEEKRNSIIGPELGNGSLLNATAQKQARKIIGLNPNYTVPDFSTPGSLSNPNQGQAASPASSGNIDVSDLLKKYGAK